MCDSCESEAFLITDGIDGLATEFSTDAELTGLVRDRERVAAKCQTILPDWVSTCNGSYVWDLTEIGSWQNLDAEERERFNLSAEKMEVL